MEDDSHHVDMDEEVEQEGNEQDTATRQMAENWRHVRLLYAFEARSMREWSLSDSSSQAAHSPLYVLASALRDVLLGLKHFHDELGTLHRDISMGNILFDPRQPRGFLIDFDLACKLDAQGLRSRRSGTLAFMAIQVLATDVPHLHSLRDDVESMLYVLLWISLHEKSDEKSKVSKNSAKTSAIDLALWQQQDPRLCVFCKERPMLNLFDKAKRQIPEKFRPIRVLLSFHLTKRRRSASKR